MPVVQRVAALSTIILVALDVATYQADHAQGCSYWPCEYACQEYEPYNLKGTT